MRKLYEKKHVTTNISAPSASASGVVVALNDLSQGSSATTRNGQQVHCVLLTCIGNWALQTATASDIGRLILFRDLTTDGTAPGVTDVLESANINSAWNRDKVGSRFFIYHDKYYPLMNSAPTVTSCIQTFHFEKKLNFTTFYAGNAGTVSDIVKNGLFLLYITVGGVCNLSANMQVCFIDN